MRVLYKKRKMKPFFTVQISTVKKSREFMGVVVQIVVFKCKLFIANNES